MNRSDIPLGNQLGTLMHRYFAREIPVLSSSAVTAIVDTYENSLYVRQLSLVGLTGRSPINLGIVPVEESYLAPTSEPIIAIDRSEYRGDAQDLLSADEARWRVTIDGLLEKMQAHVARPFLVNDTAEWSCDRFSEEELIKLGDALASLYCHHYNITSTRLGSIFQTVNPISRKLILHQNSPPSIAFLYATAAEAIGLRFGYTTIRASAEQPSDYVDKTNTIATMPFPLRYELPEFSQPIHSFAHEAHAELLIRRMTGLVDVDLFAEH